MSDESYILEADEVFGVDNVSYTAVGNVKIMFKNSMMFANYARFDVKTSIIHAEGDVTVMDENQIFKADSVQYSLTTESGLIDNATGIINGQYHICAQRINRLDKDYYHMIGVRITTCEAPIPEWSFSFYDAYAEMEGYLIGNHATGNIKDFPLFYSPKFIYPLKFERQTGLLIPRGGVTTKLGLYFSEHLFVALDIDKDFTAGGAIFSERGALAQFEYRQAISLGSKIYLEAEGINDSKPIVEDDSRYRYISKTTLALPYSLRFIADADIVSDRYYMRDFYSFNLYDRYFKNEDNVFDQTYSLTESNRYFTATVSYQEDRKFYETAAYSSKTNLISSPSLFFRNNYRSVANIFNVSANLYYDNLIYKRETNTFSTAAVSKFQEDYNRLHGYFRAYRTFNLPVTRLTPSIGLYYTQWNKLSRYTGTVNTKSVSSSTYLIHTEDGIERMLPEYSISANINEIYRNYRTGKHGIQNTLTYTFREKIDHIGMPNYLTDDLLEGKNDITWTIRSYYNPSDYRTNIALYQTATFNTENGKPLHPLKARIELGKTALFNEMLEIIYDYDSDNSTRYGNEKVSYMANSLNIYTDYFDLSGLYVYNRTMSDNRTELSVTLSTRVSDFNIFGTIGWLGDSYFMSINRLRPYLVRFGVELTAQCYNIGLVYETERIRQFDSRARLSNDERNHSVALTLSLKGVGNAGIGVYSETKDY
jgi:LPS-assembly protein